MTGFELRMLLAGPRWTQTDFERALRPKPFTESIYHHVIESRRIIDKK